MFPRPEQLGFPLPHGHSGGAFGARLTPTFAPPKRHSDAQRQVPVPLPTYGRVVSAVPSPPTRSERASQASLAPPHIGRPLSHGPFAPHEHPWHKRDPDTEHAAQITK
jgi:hypothetical protein